MYSIGCELTNIVCLVNAIGKNYPQYLIILASHQHPAHSGDTPAHAMNTNIMLTQIDIFAAMPDSLPSIPIYLDSVTTEVFDPYPPYPFPLGSLEEGLRQGAVPNSETSENSEIDELAKIYILT